MSEKVVRPANIPYPNVWLTFEAPGEDGDLVQYRIQDLPEDRFEDGIQHMLTNFMLDEPVSHARNMANDEQSVIDYTNLWRHVIFDEKMSLVCFKEGSDEIIGMNVLYIDKKSDLVDLSEFKSEHMQNYIASAVYMFERFNVFEQYKVDKFLSAVGLSVMPHYRGKGVGLKLLEARECIGKAYGLTLTSTLFTSSISQRLAAKAGFEKNFELSFEELAKQGRHVTFNVEPHSMYAIYSKRIL